MWRFVFKKNVKLDSNEVNKVIPPYEPVTENPFSNLPDIDEISPSCATQPIPIVYKSPVSDNMVAQIVNTYQSPSDHWVTNWMIMHSDIIEESVYMDEWCIYIYVLDENIIRAHAGVEPASSRYERDILTSRRTSLYYYTYFFIN